jgi:hypothetical protein
VLRREAGAGRLPVKLIDALEPLVVSGRSGSPVDGGQGREPSAGRPKAAVEPDEPDDPSTSVDRRLTVAAQRPAGAAVLSR